MTGRKSVAARMYLKPYFVCAIIVYMKELIKHIKEGTFKPAYLLCGEEDYLKKIYKYKLKEAICGDDTMNFSYYQGKDIPVAEIIDLSRTMPFFAEKRLIMIEDCGLFKAASEEMAEAVKNAPDTTVFLFVESEVDKRNRLYKAVNDVGYVCEMKTQKETDLMSWCAKQFGAAGKKITQNDMTYFLNRVGTDMNNIYNESCKLIAYIGSADIIDREAIDAVIEPQPEDRVFDMINAMSEGNVDTVMKLYADLVELKEPPLKILALLGRQFAQLYAVNNMKSDGASNQEIAARLGIRPYFIGRYVAGASHYGAAELRRAMEDCVRADNDIKTGRIEDKYAVELLVIRYTTGGNGNGRKGSEGRT